MTFKYDCTVEIDHFLQWDVSTRERQLFTPNFYRYNKIGTNYSLNSISDIVIYTELSGLNSTNIYSNIIIVYNISFAEFTVQCNSIVRNPYEPGM